MNLHLVTTCDGFRFDLVFSASQQDKKATFGTCMLDRDHHEGIYQLIQDDGAGNRLRRADDGDEIESVYRWADAGREAFRSRLLSGWIEHVELLHLPVRSPAEVATPCVANIGNPNPLEPPI